MQNMSNFNHINASRAIARATKLVHIIGHPRDAIINQTLQDIQELKNRQALTDHVLNNIFSSSHDKPHVTCLVSGEASSIKESIV